MHIIIERALPKTLLSKSEPCPSMHIPHLNSSHEIEVISREEVASGLVFLSLLLLLEYAKLDL